MKGHLKDLLLNKIRKHGPLTYPEFLEIVLFHPKWGYYNRKGEIIGKDGDYYTSSDLHPLFGWSLANLIKNLWEKDGKPRNPAVIEPGAGKGYLAHDILWWLEKENEIFRNFKYYIIEKSEKMRAREREILKNYLDKVQWINWRRKKLQSEWVFLLSNEFFDVLPFHRIVKHKDEFKELYVTYERGTFQEKEGELSSEELRLFLKRYFSFRKDGEIIEVMPDIPQIIEKLTSFVERGYFLTFDYGYWRSELRDKYLSGTLTVYHRHTAHQEPFLNLGEQDITAHVDFTLIEECLLENGFQIIFKGFQGRFLVDHGITEVVDKYSDIAPEREALKARLAMKNLVYDFGSVFKVIFASKNL